MCLFRILYLISAVLYSSLYITALISRRGASDRNRFWHLICKPPVTQCEKNREIARASRNLKCYFEKACQK
jgi:hypothetical protein